MSKKAIKKGAICVIIEYNTWCSGEKREGSVLQALVIHCSVATSSGLVPISSPHNNRNQPITYVSLQKPYNLDSFIIHGTVIYDF